MRKRYICECGETFFLKEGFRHFECYNCGRIIAEQNDEHENSNNALHEDLNLNKVSKTLKDKIKSTCCQNLGDSISGLKIDAIPGNDGISIIITAKKMRVGILKAIRDAINTYYFGEGSNKSAIAQEKVSCRCGEEERPFLDRACYEEFDEALKVQDSSSIIDSPKIEMLLRDPNKLKGENQSADSGKAPVENKPLEAQAEAPAVKEEVKEVVSESAPAAQPTQESVAQKPVENTEANKEQVVNEECKKPENRITEAYFRFGKNLKESEENGIDNKDVFVYDGTEKCPQNATKAIVKDGVASIGKGAFWDCTSLTSITIPNSVTSIGGSAFRDCPNLTVTTTNKYAQNYCNQNKIDWIEG